MAIRYFIALEKDGEFLNIFKNKRTYSTVYSAKKVAEKYWIHLGYENICVREIEVETDQEKIESLQSQIAELKSELEKDRYPKNKPNPTKYDWIICPDFLQEVDDVAREDQGEGIFDWEGIESVIIAYEKVLARQRQRERNGNDG